MKIETANEHMRSHYGITHYVDIQGEFWIGMHPDGGLVLGHGPSVLHVSTREKFKTTIDALQKQTQA